LGYWSSLRLIEVCFSFLSQALAGEFDALGVVNEAIENGVGDLGLPMISYQRSTGI